MSVIWFIVALVAALCGAVKIAIQTEGGYKQNVKWVWVCVSTFIIVFLAFSALAFVAAFARFESHHKFYSEDIPALVEQGVITLNTNFLQEVHQEVNNNGPENASALVLIPIGD